MDNFYLVYGIQWDMDGMNEIDCELPKHILVVVTTNYEDFDELEEAISNGITEGFGFCHDGFDFQKFDPTVKTHAGGGYFPERLGFLRIE